MKTTYAVTLPDGREATRSSARSYTHAVVAQGVRGGAAIGFVVAFCGSQMLAEKRLAEWQRRVPTEPAQVVPTRAVVPLTERQRAFLLEIGDRTVEIFGTSHLVPLVRRGLVERSLIGMRFWRVRRTEAGRKAVEHAS